MGNSNIGFDFLRSLGDGVFKDCEGGEIYKYYDGSGYYRGADGSYGSFESDGSGYYHGADGSYGRRDSDGSGYYHGADGSRGSLYSDGSGYYRGVDGSEWQRYSDGTGYYRSSDGSYNSFFSLTSEEAAEALASVTEAGMVAGAFFGTFIATTLVTTIAAVASITGEVIDQLSDSKKQELSDPYYQFDEWLYDDFELQQLYQHRARVAKIKLKQMEEEHKKYVEEQNKRIYHQDNIRKEKIKHIYNTITMRKTTPPASSDECKGKPYKYYLEQFENQGFYNFKIIYVNDLTYERIREEYTIERICINKTEIFQQDTPCLICSKVKIYVHRLMELKPPFSSLSAKGKNIEYIVETFHNKGFIDIELSQIPDLINGWLIKDGSVECVEINGEKKYKRNKKIRIDSKIRISYHTLK